MNNLNVVRSPFFYVGDKYKLVPQLKKLMPTKIGNYIEPFVGGGSSFLNTSGKKYMLNDIDFYVISLHKELVSYKYNIGSLLQKLFKLIDSYGLSCSFLGRTAEAELKNAYPKTYYAKMNKESYNALRNDFNNDKSDMLRLYLLLIYGFNHMIRFNRDNKFNLPVGNVDFNMNVFNSLVNYLYFMQNANIEFSNKDYKTFLSELNYTDDSYIYLDPPYLISMSEYNKLWTSSKEQELCEFLDYLNRKNIKFGITNLITHKGRVNTTFWEWSTKYNIYNIDSNYISFNDNTIKAKSKEVFVTNYGKSESKI